MSLTTAEQLRACHVRRWHIVQVAREQTLAEHSFAVAVIAGSLAASMRWQGLLKEPDQLMLLNYALQHDIVEVKTGDMPTPFKRAIEKEGGAESLDRAENAMSEDYMMLKRRTRGTEVEAIVKLADQMEAIYFLQDNGLGAHALQVLDGLRKILAEMVNDIEKQYPSLEVRSGVRKVCNEIGIHGGWL